VAELLAACSRLLHELLWKESLMLLLNAIVFTLPVVWIGSLIRILVGGVGAVKPTSSSKHSELENK